MTIAAYRSILSRGLAEAERCVARELLGASMGFRELTGEAQIVAQIVGEMKSAEHRTTAVKYLGRAGSPRGSEGRQ